MVARKQPDSRSNDNLLFFFVGKSFDFSSAASKTNETRQREWRGVNTGPSVGLDDGHA